MNHKPLVSFMMAKQQNRRLLNWSLKLVEFSFTIEYRPASVLNHAADCLSRLQKEEEVFQEKKRKNVF